MKKTPTPLVVDGSNIATEGRQMPSLSQLEEAVDAFVTEHKFVNVIVVVDATFGHRISPKERKWFDELVATNRIITPPAGAIGRGDAFILQIATRANATVLSNDSFQEFHGIHTWLFDEGRLFGGKPVPHVGWVFVSRAPVRGPASRRSVKKAKADPVGAAIDARDTDAIGTPSASERRTRVVTREEVARRVANPVAMSVGSATTNAIDDDAIHDAVDDAVVDASTRDDAHDTDTTDAPRASKRRSRRGRKSTAEVATPIAPESTGDRKFNESLAYQGFRDAHPVGSIIEVVVDRFSSHGAYAKVADVEVYVPTKALGDPPPARARDVLSIGNATLVAVDRYEDDACGIDVRAIRIDERDTYYDSSRASSSSMSSSTEVDDTTSEGSEQPTRRSEPVATKKAAAKKAPAKKAAAKKAPAKKAAAKRK